MTDTQAKPFFGDRGSSDGQLWLEDTPAVLLNFHWTAGHPRMSALHSGSDWLHGLKVLPVPPTPLPISPSMADPQMFSDVSLHV